MDDGVVVLRISRASPELTTGRQVGEKRAPCRRSTFGRRWRRAPETVGLPPAFRFYDLRHTSDTLAADTGAKLKDLMVRAGQSSQKIQLIYQHSTLEHQRRLAQVIGAHVRARRDTPGSAARLAWSTQWWLRRLVLLQPPLDAILPGRSLRSPQ